MMIEVRVMDEDVDGEDDVDDRVVNKRGQTPLRKTGRGRDHGVTDIQGRQTGVSGLPPNDFDSAIGLGLRRVT
jgi:hypothetical protein